MPALSASLTIGCVLAVAVLVGAERQQWHSLKRLAKIAASTAFVLVAVALDATESAYGQAILVALVLSWMGDACLLSERSTLFLSGLAFFLLAHVGFSVAFAFGALDPLAGAAGLALMAIVGTLVLRWLWPHLGAAYRVAVGAYLLAIVAMCSLALASGFASGSWRVGVGALAFATSDISVARDRFVARGFANKAWGLPLYYAAQLLLVWSIAG
ncbi:MAG: lysoplasmalogenase [Rhodocyclales bacterium]|nr:lysoplasmalogenase [Rhodocyclales bacterium]